MFTHTRIGFPVSSATFRASSNVRSQGTRQGIFQSSAVGAGHIASRELPSVSDWGGPRRIASSEGPDPWERGGAGRGSSWPWTRGTRNVTRQAATSVYDGFGCIGSPSLLVLDAIDDPPRDYHSGERRTGRVPKRTIYSYW